MNPGGEYEPCPYCGGSMNEARRAYVDAYLLDPVAVGRVWEPTTCWSSECVEKAFDDLLRPVVEYSEGWN